MDESPDKKAVQQIAKLPKNAVNFINMKKGLYRKTLSMGVSGSIERESERKLGKSMTIMQAYNTMFPSIAQEFYSKKMLKDQKRSKEKNHALLKLIGSQSKQENDIVSSNGYVTVIKDHEKNIMEKERLEVEKQQIMKMNFNGKRRPKSDVQMNLYISEKIS